MPFKPHSTDPDKMVYESRKYDFEPIEWRQHASAYEQGFIDGMQKQMQSSVDKAVNAMGKREWVDLTKDEIFEIANFCKGQDIFALAKELGRKLKERNT